jgi:ATP-dependent Clp protease adaptor protein ClpS
MNFTNNVQSLEMSKKQSTSKRGQWQVILHNDNHNTFDHVVTSLMEICNHNYLQAVQCANIVHYSMQCSIFVDSYDQCDSVYHELRDLGLTTTLSKYKKS